MSTRASLGCSGPSSATAVYLQSARMQPQPQSLATLCRSPLDPAAPIMFHAPANLPLPVKIVLRILNSSSIPFVLQIQRLASPRPQTKVFCRTFLPIFTPQAQPRTPRFTQSHVLPITVVLTTLSSSNRTSIPTLVRDKSTFKDYP